MRDNSDVAGATVSLPQMQQSMAKKTPEGFVLDDSRDITSKDTIEQMFNEELSFGSKPLTRVPRNTAYPEVGMKSKRFEDLPRSTEAQSKAQHDITQVHQRNTKGCFVKMPGVKTKHNPIFWKRSNNGKGFSKPRPSKAPFSKENNTSPPVSTAPNGGPNADSRKAGSLKAPIPSNATVAQHKSSPPAVPDNAAPAGKRGSHFKAPRGRGQNAPVKST